MAVSSSTLSSSDSSLDVASPSSAGESSSSSASHAEDAGAMCVIAQVILVDTKVKPVSSASTVYQSGEAPGVSVIECGGDTPSDIQSKKHLIFSCKILMTWILIKENEERSGLCCFFFLYVKSLVFSLAQLDWGMIYHLYVDK